MTMRGVVAFGVIVTLVSALAYLTTEWNRRESERRAEVHQLYRVEPARLKSRVGAPFSAGEKVVESLNHFRTAHGGYPQRLDELVPRFLSAVPHPGWGRNEWVYTTHSPDSFSLRVYFESKTSMIDSPHYGVIHTGEWYYTPE